MADFLAQKRAEIDERLTELKPLVNEYNRLMAAESALNEVLPPKTQSPRHASRQRADAKTPSRRAAKRGRPKGTGTRSAEALALVKGKPGITIPEIAEKMGIKQNYLYRVLPGLAADGLVKKEGKGWFPRDSA